MVREEIAARGPLPFHEFVERALYHPEHGFYVRGGKAGRRGDFLTSPEVGPLFGQLVANALDREWDRLGQPEVFTVIDMGAGPGTLARTVLAADFRARSAMRYIAVERSVDQRSNHPEEVLSVETIRLGDEVVGDGIVGVIIANELLDNLAFTPLRRDDHGALRAAVVTVDGGGSLQLEAGAELEGDAATLFDDTVESAVLQAEAAAWMTTMHDLVISGRIIVIDYARMSSEEVEVRTYADHGYAGDPLVEVGSKDITVDLDLEQLQRATVPASAIATQADWLAGLGIDGLVDEGRQLWEQGAATGSLAALKARSRVREAEALTEADGLGGFYVAEWIIDGRNA